MQTIELPGVVEPGCLYLASEVRQRLKIGTWAWRKMRRAGLRVIYEGKRSYVLGDDVLAFFANSKAKQLCRGGNE